MRKCFAAWLVGVMLWSSGCQTPLDKKQAELIREWSTTNKMFADAVTAYHEVMSTAVEKHYTRVRDAENEKFRAWVESQVREGKLVLTDANDVPKLEDGKYLPMEYEPLKRTYDRHLAALTKIEQDEERFLRIDAEIASAVKQFRSLSELNLEQSEKIAEAKASAQQVLESSLSVIAGLAAAAAAGS